MSARQKNIYISLFCGVIACACFGEADNARATPHSPVRLVLPPAIYVVPGHEMNIYFDNIVLVPNIKNYLFDVDCEYGRQDQERWRFTPEDKDVGDFPLSIKVFDADGKLLDEAITTVYVSPKDAGKDKSISIMLVGDSLTRHARYTQEFYRLLKADGNPDVKFIGSHSGAKNPPKDGAPCQEGYSGWGWGSFSTAWSDATNVPAYRRKSPFLVLKDGKPVLDFKAYCDKYNDGKAPDYIIITLGANDVASANDVNIEKTIDAMLRNADILINEFKRVGASTKIGLGVGELPAATQDAFGNNYQCGLTRWQYKKNMHRVIEKLFQKFADRKKENLFVIPLYVNIDCVNNYPKREEQINARNSKKISRDRNGLHPANAGHHQLADSFYCWFKYELNFKPNRDRVLYVSPKGSDANDGLSIETAFQSVSKAAKTVKPGDLVLVKGGIYREQVVLRKSGTKEKPIVFQGMPGETAVITWGWDLNDWKKVEGTRFCYETTFPYVIILMWERRTLSRYLEIEDLDLLDNQPGAFVFNRGTGKLTLHAFDGGNPEFAGIVAVPYKDDKSHPMPRDKETSKRYSVINAVSAKGIFITGHYNQVYGFELAFHPIGAQIEAKDCIVKNNIIYGCTSGISTRRSENVLIENNRIYKTTGSGVFLSFRIKDVRVIKNYLFNNGPCDPFLGQKNGSEGYPYNLAQYGRNAENVKFVDNAVISDDSSRRFGVMRCKGGGIAGNMEMHGNVFIGGDVDPGWKDHAVIKNNTVVNGTIRRYGSAGEDVFTAEFQKKYNAEIGANLTRSMIAQSNPCFADPSFYDYRLRKDSPFAGNGAYPVAGQVLYVDPSVKDEGDGSSPAKALKRFDAAMKKAVSGNCVYLLPGIYKENTVLDKIGGDENVSIRNYGKGKVVFENSQLKFNECKNIVFDGIIFKTSIVSLQNSPGMGFTFCVFDGGDSGVKANNSGQIKMINNTFINKTASMFFENTSVILRNNLFVGNDVLPLNDRNITVISENNVFAGDGSGEILQEWKGKYHETIPSFTADVKLSPEKNYTLPQDSRLAFSGLNCTPIGARGPEKKDRRIIVENLRAVTLLPDSVTLQWETPFDYPDASICCKDGAGNKVCVIPVLQGQYKISNNSASIKGLKPNSKYNIIFTFSNPGGQNKTEETLAITTPANKEFHPKTVYVAKSGNDSRSGLSESEAKKSICAALSAALPGDTVLVGPGTYTEQNRIFTIGVSKDKPFVLKSDKPGKAIINCNYCFDYAFSIYGGKNIVIDGFKITGLRYTSISTALNINKSEGIIIRNCVFDRNRKGCSNQLLLCKRSTDIEVSNSLFDGGFQGVNMYGCNRVKVVNNTFWRLGINAVAIGCPTTNAEVNVYNNIFMDVTSPRKSSPAVVLWGLGTKVFCDYNLYWRTDYAPKMGIFGLGGKMNGATYDVLAMDKAGNLEKAHETFGVETHGHFGDPLFQDPPNGDFRLKPDSPAWKMGKDGSQVGMDMSRFF